MDLDTPIALVSGHGAFINGHLMQPAQALSALRASPHLTCHTGFLVERLGFAAAARKTELRSVYEQKHFDVAELFAFVCPALMAVPTPAGLARVLSLKSSATLPDIASELLRRLADPRYPLVRETAENATFLARAN